MFYFNTHVSKSLDMYNRYADAELDCTKAIILDGNYVKAHHHRGKAHKELQNYLVAVGGKIGSSTSKWSS